MNAERVLAITRDAGCIVLSLTGIAWQQYTGNVNAMLLGAYMTLLGIPVGMNVRAIRRQVQAADRQQRRGAIGTRDSSSSSPSGSSRSRSSSARGPKPKEDA